MTTGTASKKSPVHYVIWVAEPGGIASYIQHYIKKYHLDREVFVYSLRPIGNKLNVEPVDHFFQGSYSNWECFWKFFLYCRAHRNDNLHLLNIGPFMLLIALLAGARNVVYHIHGTKHWKPGWNKFILRIAWKLTGYFPVQFIANSVHCARIFRRDALPVQPRIIYNGFELSGFLEKRLLRTKLTRIVYAGRFDPGKNVDQVIRLFEELAPSKPDLELHLAGEGSLEKKLEQQARKSPFSDRIFFHGWVNDMASFFQSADLFLFLSDHESFGNVLAEALLTGLPVLTSDIPAFQEIHGGEKMFYVGHPSQYEDLKAQFLDAVDHYPQLAEKAYSMAERLIRLFDMEIHLKKIESCYEPA